MNAEAPQYQYDVAFSFLARDLGIAEQLGDRLAPLKTFIYKREQEDLAGTNGMETFAQVFRERARLNVVLLRERWGETDWTRVESMAIQARALKGWQSLFVVKLDSATPPPWIPPQLIHFDFEAYGLEQAVGAIRARALEIGAPSRRESPEELAQRLAKRAAQARDNDSRWRSEVGVRLAEAEVRQLFADMKAALDRIPPGGADSAAIECATLNTEFGIRCNGKSMSAVWHCPIGNSLDRSRLYVVHYPGLVSLPGQPSGYFIDQPGNKDEWRILPEFSDTGALHWRDDRLPSAVSRAALAEHLLKSFLEYAYGANQGEGWLAFVVER